MTICTLELTASWQPRQGYPSLPSRYGEHLRKGRLDLHLTQRELAIILEVYESTIDKWERQGMIPQEHNQIKIKEFLGYDPNERNTNILKKENYECTKEQSTTHRKFRK